MSHLMELSGCFEIIHNHFDFLPLTYSRLIKTPIITTIHEFSCPGIIPAYKVYNDSSASISISNADRNKELTYLDTIYHGVEARQFNLQKEKDNYLLNFGRIHPERGTHEAIAIARKSGHLLKIAGLIQDKEYFEKQIKPFVGNVHITYLGYVWPEVRNVLLGKAKALLHPIFFEDPFGLSVLEARMCGIPVIAFTRGSIPKLVKDGYSGYLVNSVAEDVVAVEKLVQISPENCRKHAVENLSPDKMVESYIQAYHNVLRADSSILESRQ